MKGSSDAGLARVIDTLGISSSALLGQGSESRVLALDGERIARVNRVGTSRERVTGRTALLSELGQSAGRVPFAIPAILDTSVLVQLDAFPGNMLVEGGIIKAVIDFGAFSIMGDRRLDPLTAAVYLDPAITPVATDRDRSVAQEWLASHGLAGLYTAAQNWIAAYWSFARDDANLYRWCRAILVD